MLVAITCPTILTNCPELDGAVISKLPSVGDTYTDFPVSSVIGLLLFSISAARTLTYPSKANGLIW